MQFLQFVFYIILLGAFSLIFSQSNWLTLFEAMVYSVGLFVAPIVFLWMYVPKNKLSGYFLLWFNPQKKSESWSQTEVAQNKQIFKLHKKYVLGVGLLGMLINASFAVNGVEYAKEIIQQILLEGVVSVLFVFFLLEPIRCHLEYPEKSLGLDVQQSFWWQPIPYAPAIATLFLVITIVSPLMNQKWLSGQKGSSGTMEFYSEVGEKDHEPYIFPFKALNVERSDFKVILKFHANLGLNHTIDLEKRLLEKEPQLLERLNSFLQAVPGDYFLQFGVKKKIEEKFLEITNQMVGPDFHLSSLFISDFSLQNQFSKGTSGAREKEAAPSLPDRAISSQPR